MFCRVEKKGREGELDKQKVKVLGLTEKGWSSGRQRHREDRRILRLVIRYSVWIVFAFIYF